MTDHRIAAHMFIGLVTHNLQQAARIADHTAFMHIGEKIEIGETEQISPLPKIDVQRITSAEDLVDEESQQLIRTTAREALISIF